MKSKTFTRITKVLLLAVLFLLVGVRGWGNEYYWIGGTSGNMDDGSKWASTSGGTAIGGTISFNQDYSDNLFFDGNSGSNISVAVNGNFLINSISIESSQQVSMTASSIRIIELSTGIIGGTVSSEFIIGVNLKILNYGNIDAGSNTNSINRITINGTLESWGWVNSDYFTLNTGGLFRTNYVSSGSGWWYGMTATAGNQITSNGRVEYMSNGQKIVNISYYDLLFSGDPLGLSNLLTDNIFVKHEIEINAPLDLNGKAIYFKGTTFINNVELNSSSAQIVNSDETVYPQKTYSGSGSIIVGSFWQSSAQNVIINANMPITSNNVTFDGIGSINNTNGSFTVGNGSSSATITLEGAGARNVGSFTKLPYFGTGALTINYNNELSARTTGFEMPASTANVVIKNTKGILINTEKTITNSLNVFFYNPTSKGVLNLNGQVLHFTGTTLTNGGTILGIAGSTLSFEKSSSQTLSLTNSTSTLIDILKVDNTGLTVSAASSKSLIANNVYFNNSGGITNTSTTTTIGSGASAIIEFNNTHGGSCGNFGVAPTFNVSNSGSNGLTVNYKTESANRTIGVEMPATAANIYISNTNGITDNGSYSLTGTLNIAAGYLQINPNKDMTVNGATTITPASGIKIKSSSAGTGSLITNGSVGGPGTTYIERYITGNTALNGALKYHQVSVPLIGDQNGNTCYFSAVWMHSYLFDYTESDDSWFNWNSGTGNYCPTNKGYLIYHRLWPDQATADTTYTMTGKLNTGSYSPPVTKVGNGFNLIPNPYPSSINWNASSGWSFNNMSNSIWIYNAIDMNYGVAERSGNGTIVSGTLGTSTAIQVGQAFFVKAINSSPTISMNDNVRIHNSSQGFLKNSDAIANSLRLNIQGNSSADEILVNFAFDATTGYDSHYDAEKFTGPETSPQLSALNPSSDKYSIIGLPLSSDETVLPLNLNMNYSGELTFTASQLESFTTGTSIKLEDKQLAKTIDLISTPTYSFTHTPDDADDRFVLHFGSVLGFDDNHALLTSSVTVNGKQISVSYPTTSGKHLSASIFDTQGRLLKQVSLNGSGNDSFTLSETSGVYLLRLTLPGGNETHKIVVL